MTTRGQRTVLLLAALLWGCGSGETTPGVVPELLSVTGSEATIAWTTPAATTGEVRFAPLSGEAQERRATEALGPTTQHEVVLDGLSPGTSYAYRLGDGAARYVFRTRPRPTEAFSLAIVWGTPGPQLGQLLADAPDLLLTLTPRRAAGEDPLSTARPYLPIFDLGGRDSPYLRSLGQARQPQPGTWSLDWGGLRLIVSPDGAVASQLDAPAAHTVGVIIDEGVRTARADELHGALVAHNARKLPSRAAFVLVRGASGPLEERDGVRYLPLPTKTESGGSLRLDVSLERCAAHGLGRNEPMVLRPAPLGTRRTCEECRRLADRGAYEESVAAYEQFIATNTGHHQIDDAYFEIARILDEKLLRPAAALPWYDRLPKDFPRSTLASLAGQRAAYLRAHADHDFAPLVRFEAARSRPPASDAAAGDPERSRLDAVARLIERFPDASITPTMRYWLANQHRRSAPDEAVRLFRATIAAFPDHELAADARLEIAETYYDAKRFSEASSAFRAAAAALPERAEEALARAQRADRNLQRRYLAAGAGLLLLLLLGAGLLASKGGGAPAPWKLSAAGFGTLSVAVLAGGWLLHEQFGSFWELLGIALGLGASAALPLVPCRALAGRLVGGRGGSAGAATVALGAALALLAFAAGGLLTLFLANEHYLVIVGL